MLDHQPKNWTLRWEDYSFSKPPGLSSKGCADLSIRSTNTSIGPRLQAISIASTSVGGPATTIVMAEGPSDLTQPVRSSRAARSQTQSAKPGAASCPCR